MVLSTTKPIIVTFEGLPSQQYHAYTVGLRYVDGNTYAYNAIFTGRTWSDNNGRASMRIDGLLRDYVAHQYSIFEAQTQQQHPANMQAPTGVIQPIENGQQFMITEVMISCYDQQQYIYVWGGFVAPWQAIELPTDGEGKPDACNLAILGSGVLPHVPPVHSNNMFVGLSLYFPRLVESLYYIGFAQLHRFNLTIEGAGVMCATWTLNDLFAALAQRTIIDGGTPTSVATTIIDGGTPTSTAAVVIDGGTPAQTATDTDDDQITTGTLYFYEGDNRGDAFCVVDDCTADYYVAWETPQGGWTCYGFSGNAVVSGTPSITDTLTANDRDEVLLIEQQHTYNLYTEPLTQTVYGHLAALKYTREVYLYDSRNDRGCYCTVEGRGIDTMPTRTGKLKPFNVVLKEKQHLSL